MKYVANPTANHTNVISFLGFGQLAALHPSRAQSRPINGQQATTTPFPGAGKRLLPDCLLFRMEALGRPVQTLPLQIISKGCLLSTPHSIIFGGCIGCHAGHISKARLQKGSSSGSSWEFHKYRADARTNSGKGNSKFRKEITV